MKLGGSLTRQKEEDMTVSDASPHVANIGSMVEVGKLAALSWIGLTPYRTWRTPCVTRSTKFTSERQRISSTTFGMSPACT